MEKVYENVIFNHPSRWIIYGPSGSGKSTFVENLMLNSKDLFGSPFETIMYCSGQSFPAMKKFHGVSILECDNVDPIYVEDLNTSLKNLIIIDDNMYKASNDIAISDLFTKKSHHKNITIVMLTQNLFPKSKYMRDINLNSNYIVLMKNPGDLTQIKTLSRRTDENPNFIFNAYRHATRKEPYSYLLLDMCQTTPVELKARSCIFPDGMNQIVYLK